MSEIRTPITTDIDFTRDGKQASYFRVPHSRNDSAWASLPIPMTVVKNGTGPTVLFTAGIHGGEYEGPVTLMNLSRELAVEQVQGRVILLPALNLPAVQAGQRLSPLDGKDLNRVFPGSPTGSVTQLIAHYVHDHILPLCDAVIDLHSGGTSLDFIPYISMHELGDPEMNQRTRAALEAFQAPIALVIEEITGEGLLDYAVERMGKLFLSAELGGAGTLSPRGLRIARLGVRNLLKHFEIIAGEPLSSVSQGLPESRAMQVPGVDSYHSAPVSGIYESRFELSEQIEQGEVLGQIHSVTDLENPPRALQAQRSGTLIVTRGPGHVRVGDTVAVLAQDRSSGAISRARADG